MSTEQLSEQAHVGKDQETDLVELERTIGELQALRENLNSVIRGKGEQIEILIISLIAGGSVLLEDVPGVVRPPLPRL
jgi:MoxR-like ATPase